MDSLTLNGLVVIPAALALMTQRQMKKKE